MLQKMYFSTKCKKFKTFQHMFKMFGNYVFEHSEQFRSFGMFSNFSYLTVHGNPPHTSQKQRGPFDSTSNKSKGLLEIQRFFQYFLGPKLDWTMLNAFERLNLRFNILRLHDQDIGRK